MAKIGLPALARGHEERGHLLCSDIGDAQDFQERLGTVWRILATFSGEQRKIADESVRNALKSQFVSSALDWYRAHQDDIYKDEVFSVDVFKAKFKEKWLSAGQQVKVLAALLTSTCAAGQSPLNFGNHIRAQSKQLPETIKMADLLTPAFIHGLGSNYAALVRWAI